MNKDISYKLVSVVFAVMTISFLMVFYSFAWTDPISNPPSGDVPAPLNTGDSYLSGSIKDGGLIVGNTVSDTIGIGFSVAHGNAGIGITNPSKKLDVAGDIQASGDICLTNGTCLSTAGGSGGGITGFGDWVDVTALAAGGAVRQAATDGFLFAHGTSLSVYIEGRTDSFNPPTTVRVRTSISPAAGEIHSIMMPVKRNHYWRLMNINTTTYRVWWLPLQ